MTNVLSSRCSQCILFFVFACARELVSCFRVVVFAQTRVCASRSDCEKVRKALEAGAHTTVIGHAKEKKLIPLFQRFFGISEQRKPNRGNQRAARTARCAGTERESREVREAYVKERKRCPQEQQSGQLCHRIDQWSVELTRHNVRHRNSGGQRKANDASTAKTAAKSPTSSRAPRHEMHVSQTVGERPRRISRFGFAFSETKHTNKSKS